jgi:hypothetical protein
MKNKYTHLTNIPSTPEDYMLYRITTEIERHNKKQLQFIKSIDAFMTEEEDNETKTQDND